MANGGMMALDCRAGALESRGSPEEAITGIGLGASGQLKSSESASDAEGKPSSSERESETSSLVWSFELGLEAEED